MTARERLAAAEAEAARLQAEVAEWRRDRAEHKDLEHLPDTRAEYDREVAAREAALVAAEGGRATCLAELDAQEARRATAKAEAKARLGLLIGVAGIVMTATKIIYDLLK